MLSNSPPLQQWVPRFMHHIQPRAAAELLHALQAMINTMMGGGDAAQATRTAGGAGTRQRTRRSAGTGGGAAPPSVRLPHSDV